MQHMCNEMKTKVLNFLRKFSANLRLSRQSALIRLYTKDNACYLCEVRPSSLQKLIHKWMFSSDPDSQKNITMTDNAAFFDPPESVRGMKVLDRNLFRKTVLIPGLAVPEKSIGKVAKSLKKEVLRFRSIKPVVELSAKDSLAKNHKLMLFNPLKIKSAEDFNEDQRTVLEKLNVVLSSFQFYSFDMKYDNWDHAEIIKAVLPEELEAVTGFAIVGHIAHLNLRDGADDYKNLIGQVILDKHRTIKTVVNKLKSIDSEFRNFKMELLAGEPDFTTTVKEHGCTFTFDFSKVYWNTKLGTEHNLVASQIKQEDTVFDVFAGVGPFAVPCGKKGITVFANDLNPDSYESLVLNVSKNKANQNSNVHCFNMDGRDFIKQIFSKEMESRWKDPSPKGTVHVLMNLPALAVEFLDSFVGLFNQSSCKPKDPNCLPYVHCYYFSKCENLEQDTKEAVERVLGCTLDDNVSIREVRNVAPGKEMMCIKFRVPESVLFKGNVETEGLKQNMKMILSVMNTIMLTC